MRRPALALALLPALMQATLPAAAQPVSGFTLDNGLQVVVIEDRRAPVVTQMVWYRVGAADEPPGKSGIAHFLEHLMFKATETLADGEFSATVEAQGGDDNAFTSWDYTAYFQNVAADRLSLMMAMEADRMRNLRLTEDEVATERQVILEERAQRTDSDPGALFSEQRRAAQYLNHPYGIPVIGWRHEIEALSREDALAFYRRYYAPNNAIVVVAGDVTADEVRRLAGEHYAPLAPSADLPPRVRPQEPPQLAERRLVMEDARVAQPYVLRTYLAPERDPGDQAEAAALTFLAELLGGSPTTSHFARALQFDTQTAVWSTAFYDGTSVDRAEFGIAVAPAQGITLAEAEAAMDAALARFLDEGIDAAAFERLRFRLRADEVYLRDDPGRVARRTGEALATGLTLADVQAWPDLLQSVTPEQVMAAAERLFVRDRAVTGWLVAPGEAGQ
jgi:zinc protease